MEHQQGYDAPNYTQTPNPLFDEHMRDMSEVELKVVLAAVRKTFGHHRTSDAISLTQFEELTGLSRQGVLDGIERAMKRGVLCHAGNGKRGVAVYSLNLRSTGLQNRPVQIIDWSKSLTRTGLQNRPELVYKIDTQKKKRKEKKESAGAEGASTTPAAVMNSLKDAIVLAMGWSWQTMTKTEKGTVQTAAKSFAEANATPDEIASCKAECDNRQWKNYGPVALAKVLSDVRKAAAPVPASTNGNGKRKAYYQHAWVAPERLAPDGTLDGVQRPGWMLAEIAADGEYDGVALRAGEKVYDDGTLPLAWQGLE